MDAISSSGWNALDDGDQFTGRVNRSRFHDGSRDLARLTLLAEFVNQVCQFPFRRIVYDIGCGLLDVRTKAHVERSIQQKREPSLGRVKLHRRRTEIEQDAIHFIPTE